MGMILLEEGDMPVGGMFNHDDWSFMDAITGSSHQGAWHTVYTPTKG